MSNKNEILTIAGEQVEVRYESDFYEACGKCCFHNIFVACNVRTLCHGCPCDKYSDDKNRRFAYFVRAEEIANKPQMDANKNEPTREKKADFLQTNDADKAANKYARDTFINECMENGSCDANDLADAFKAGIAYERERLMKEAPVADIIKMRGNTDTEYPLVLTLGFPRLPNIEYHGGKVRVIIEEIKD